MSRKEMTRLAHHSSQDIQAKAWLARNLSQSLKVPREAWEGLQGAKAAREAAAASQNTTQMPLMMTSIRPQKVRCRPSTQLTSVYQMAMRKPVTPTAGGEGEGVVRRGAGRRG
jgi:hypothetical protein